MRAKDGFTLIELLIVIGILAVLMTVAILVVNPAQLFAQGRDTQRISEVASLNRGLQYADLFGLSGGTPQIVYVSIPDSDPACGNSGLPALASGWTYACSTPANYRKVDGSGWIPVNFASTGAVIFSVLPIDPVNTVTGDYYYTYSAGSWVITAALESEKYLATDALADAGADPNRIETGPEIILWGQSGGGGLGDGGNTAPTASNLSVTTSYNTPLVITLAGTDSQQCSLTFTVLSSPVNGSLSSITGQACISGNPKSDQATVTFTPVNGFSGSNSFTYQVNDGSANSSVATVSITVNPQGNTAPTSANKTVSTNYNTALPVTLTATDSEQCDLVFSIVTGPTHGSVGAITNQACASASPNSDSGSVTYTPTSGYSGADTFTYRVSDGTNNSNTATVSITVNAQGNTLPTADNRVLTPVAGVAETATLYGRDSEQCTLTFSIVTGPTHGSLGSITNQACVSGSPNIDSATVPYTATAGYFGSDSFTYKVNDATGDSNVATVSATVTLPAPTVTAVNPVAGVNSASVALTSVTGTNFVTGATVKLTKSGQSNVTCTGVTVASATSITGGSCPITGAVTGTWNVVVTNPDAQAATLSNGFTITAPAGSGPVGYWNMNEGVGTTAADSSGQGNTGSFVDAPTWVAGKSGTAISFDGSNDAINIATNASFNNFGTGDFSIAWWHKDSGVFNSSSGYNSLIANSKEEAGGQWGCLFRNAFKLICVINRTEAAAANTAVPANVWVHLAAVRAGSTVTYYYNGQPDGSGTVSAGSINNNDPLRMGMSTQGVSRAHRAVMDEVRLYDRALSASEVAALYNNP